jgi:hypothetical protein
MNWGAIGAIGEIVGATGVILTLGYLAVQIRQNTKFQKSAIAQATLSSRTSWYELGACDPEFTLLYTKGHARPEELSDDERTRFIWMIARLFSTFEETFAQYQLEMISESEWARIRSLLRNMLENSVLDEWWRSGATVFTDSFVKDITPGVNIKEWTRESIAHVTEKNCGHA